jgi:hypothetical protein
VFLHIDSGVENSRNQKIDDFLSSVATVTNCPLRRITSKWIDGAELRALMDKLKRDVADRQRNLLLVSGSHLEDQVTVCALEALVEGFSVHLLCDIIASREAKMKPVLLLRLLQAGAVPSSLRQFLYMWLAAAPDHDTKGGLEKLLENYDSVFGMRPA